MTSSAFAGEVVLEFDDAGNLIRYDASAATLSETQQRWMLHNLPKHLAHVTKVLGGSPTAKLTEIKEEITFDKFWNRYDMKVQSSKKKSQQRWNRMSKSERYKAFNYIGKYEMNIPNGVSKKYAETYLNSEVWNNG